jgi:hypothetical protein
MLDLSPYLSAASITINIFFIILKGMPGFTGKYLKYINFMVKKCIYIFFI